MKRRIHSQMIPKAIGPYSEGIQAGSTVYLSGQIPLDPGTMTLVSGEFDAQARQVFMNLQEACKAAGASMDNIVKLTIYLTDLAYFQNLNDIMVKFFSEPFPARSTLQVSALPKSAKIEIDAILVI